MYDAGSYTVSNPSAFNKLMVTFTYDGTLPVELSSFTALLLEDYVRLEWTTANEIFNYGFNIEKSKANCSWTKIGFVTGCGNSNSPKYYSFEDQDLTGSGVIQYRLKQIDNDGSYKYSPIVEVLLPCDEYKLFQNFPNPFNPTTTIKFSIPETALGINPGKVILKVYDIMGKEVATLMNKMQPAGNYQIEFSAIDGLASGIYFYTLQAGNFEETKKMILLK